MFSLVIKVSNVVFELFVYQTKPVKYLKSIQYKSIQRYIQIEIHRYNQWIDFIVLVNLNSVNLLRIVDRINIYPIKSIQLRACRV